MKGATKTAKSILRWVDQKASPSKRDHNGWQWSKERTSSSRYLGTIRLFDNQNNDETKKWATWRTSSWKDATRMDHYLKRSWTRNLSCDHDQLCRLDILGVEDQPSGYQEFAYKEFKDQLQRHAESFYETPLIWKVGHPTLDKKKGGSLLHLKNLLVKLKKDPELF